MTEKQLFMTPRPNALPPLAALGIALIFVIEATFGRTYTHLGVTALIFAVAGFLIISDTRLCLFLLFLSLPFVTTDLIKTATGKFAGFGLQPAFMMTLILCMSIFMRAAAAGKMAKIPKSNAHIAAIVLFGTLGASVIPPLLAPPPGIGPAHYLKFANMMIFLSSGLLIYFAINASLRGRENLFKSTFLFFAITDFACLYGIFRTAAWLNPSLAKFDALRRFVDNNNSYKINEGATTIMGIMIPRIRGTSFEPTGFGDFLLASIPALICLAMNIGAVPKKFRVFVWISLLLIMVVFVLTSARAAMLGLCFSLAIIFALEIINGRFARKALRIAAVAVSAIVLFSALSLVVFKDPAIFLKEIAPTRFSTAFVEDDLSIVSRISALKKAKIDFENSPVWGRGFAIAGFYSYPESKFGNDWAVERNLASITIGESGLIGAAVFLFFFIAVMGEGFRAWRHSRGDRLLNALATGFLASFAGMTISRFTGLEIHAMHYWAIIALTVASGAIAASQNKKNISIQGGPSAAVSSPPS